MNEASNGAFKNEAAPFNSPFARQSETINTMFSQRALTELNEARDAVREINDNPAMKLKILCESVAMLMAAPMSDSAGVYPWTPALSGAYNAFCIEAVNKAKELL